jgi:hypothetical protein
MSAFPCSDRQARDPRIDPQAGDIIVTTGGDRYEVAWAVAGEVMRTITRSDGQVIHNVSGPVRIWREWADRAEVIHAA